MSTRSSSGSSADTDELIAFCIANPIPDCDPERFLRFLSSGAEAHIDGRDLGFVGAVLDKIVTDGRVPIELAGVVGGRISPLGAARFLSAAEDYARRIGCTVMELSVQSPWAGLEPFLVERGWTQTYGDIDLVCRNPDWGADRPLPEGWCWIDVAPDYVDAYADLLRAAFATMPGTFVPDRDEIKRYISLPEMGTRLLLDDGQVARGLLRYNKKKGYIHAVARDPACQGQGIGRFVMDEARRRFDGQQMRLSVVDTNRPALDLYLACNFEIETEVPAFMYQL